MNWEMVGAIGEVSGALAVLATLAYLAVQIRQSNKLTTTSIYESAMDGYIRLNQLVVNDAEAASIFQRGFSAISMLNEEENFRYNMMFRAFLNHIYKLFRLYEQGVFSVQEWSNSATEAAQFLRTDGGRLFRQQNQYFSDLYNELDRYEEVEFSTFETRH